MDSRHTHIAFVLKGRLLHLCVEGGADVDTPVQSLCGVSGLQAPRARAAQTDLANMYTLIICRACELRYDQLGYRAMYTAALQAGASYSNQLALF